MYAIILADKNNEAKREPSICNSSIYVFNKLWRKGRGRDVDVVTVMEKRPTRGAERAWGKYLYACWHSSFVWVRHWYHVDKRCIFIGWLVDMGCGRLLSYYEIFILNFWTLSEVRLRLSLIARPRQQLSVTFSHCATCDICFGTIAKDITMFDDRLSRMAEYCTVCNIV